MLKVVNAPSAVGGVDDTKVSIAAFSAATSLKDVLLVPLASATERDLLRNFCSIPTSVNVFS